MTPDAAILSEALVRRRRDERRLAAVGAFLLTLILALSGALQPIDNRLAEYRASLLNRPSSGEVAIVEIDAKSIAAIKKWPWSRGYHAALIRRLHAAGASMIAFDVDFSANSDPVGDAALAHALNDVQPVILPVFEQRASTDLSDGAMLSNRPAASLGSSWVGDVNILPGTDGVVRQFPAATVINGRIQPAMATLLSDNSSFGDGTFVPDWSIDARRIPRMSFIDVLKGHVPAQAIRGKRLIVGATAIELGDRYTIPRFGTVPGVVIQALAADSLIQHRGLWQLGMLPILGSSVLVILLVGAAIRGIGIRSQLLASSILALVLGAPVALQAYWPISVDAAVPLSAALFAIGSAFFIEVRHRRRLQSLRDSETGLPNVDALTARLNETVTVDGMLLTAAGIERFEAIRSVIGNKGMVELMRQASARLGVALGRPVYRIAPDALAWLTSSTEEGDTLSQIAEKAFEGAFRIGAQTVDVRCTMGLAPLPEDGDWTVLVERSLAAVHLARSLGTSRHRFQAIAPETVRNLSIMGDLRRGLETGEVFVAYQPKLDAATGRIDSAEALVRWHHPVEGFIAPDRFIPLAEETGEIRHLTRFVLAKVMDDWRHMSATKPGIGISVNVSTADLADPGFADEVEALIAAYGVDPSKLTIEITESAIIKSHETAADVLGRLRERGIRLSIDDYGTGQSTLSYLKKLPVDELKIDKMFVSSVASSENDRIMVRSTIDLAHELKIKVVAEGAEDWKTVDVLRDLDCDYVQGFVIGKAMPAEEFLRASLGEFPARRAA